MDKEFLNVPWCSIQCFFFRIVDGNEGVFFSDSGKNKTTFCPNFFAPSARFTPTRLVPNRFCMILIRKYRNTWVGEGYKLQGSGGGSPQENFEVFCTYFKGSATRNCYSIHTI